MIRTLKRHVSASAIGMAVVATALAATPAAAGSVENLERERAMLIETYLDPELTPDERESRIRFSQRRLVDLERMTLRDDGLVGNDTPAVRRAFDNYDLTFLVHASAEKEMSILDNWLEQVGLTTQSLMATKSTWR